MQASIRELKSHLSEYLRHVQAGETVIVSAHNRPVARIVPIQRQTTLDELTTTPGISWNGGKAAGLPRGEAMPTGVSLADWVAEDRR